MDNKLEDLKLSEPRFFGQVFVSNGQLATTRTNCLPFVCNATHTHTHTHFSLFEFSSDSYNKHTHTHTHTHTHITAFFSTFLPQPRTFRLRTCWIGAGCENDTAHVCTFTAAIMDNPGSSGISICRNSVLESWSAPQTLPP